MEHDYTTLKTMSMNEIIRNEETMSSLEIAALVGKKHKNVLREIRSMEPAWESQSGLKFELGSYKDKQNQSRPCYYLKKRECLYVATKFNNDARAKLVLRWEELEKANMQRQQEQFQVPTSFREALLLAAEQQAKIEEQQKLIEAKEEQVSELTNKVAEMSEKVSYLDQILKCKSTILVTTIAQDYGFSPKAFNKMLNEMGIQHKVDDQWILYAKYISEGYVHSEAIEIQTSYGIKIKYLTKWTQKGRLFLYEQLKANGILPLIEQ